jgi:methylmalonyl-CoA epimerase
MSDSSDIQFDHIGVAASDPEAFNKVARILGISKKTSEVVESEKVKVHFYPMSSEGQVEILEPTDPESAIQKFMDKKGSGIHHLCFRVKDIKAKEKVLRENAIRLIYDSPQPGAHGMLVNFIHPKSTGGVLIEIAQKNPSS